ncbi:MAG: hypothetical protein IJX81_00925 [Clostridia bacterium]|nr:hypothetical protein [Clostridia bacterium]
MNATEEKKIIFVCTGNTCRSPMAEAIFRYELKRLGVTGVTVSSAGTLVGKSAGMNPHSLQVLSENGFYVWNFSSTQLDSEMILNAHAIVCMTDEHRDVVSYMRYKLLSEREDAENNVYSFSDFVGYEIPDPYGQGIESYREVFAKLLSGMPKIVEGVFPKEEKKEKMPPKEKKPRKPRAKPRKRTTGGKTGTKKTTTKKGEGKK